MSRTSAGLAPGGCALSNALEVRSWPCRKTPAGKKEKGVVRVRCSCLVMVIEELKHPRRRRQQERLKFACLTMKNNSSARFARAFFIFKHAADVLDLFLCERREAV